MMLKYIHKAKALKTSEENGFTLLELVIVVAVIGILTAIAIPAYGAIQVQARQNAVDATTRNIVNEFQRVDAESGITVDKAKEITDRYYYGGLPTPDYYKEGVNIVSYLTGGNACAVSVWINGGSQASAQADIGEFFSYAGGPGDMQDSPIEWSAIFYGPLQSSTNTEIVKVTPDNFRALGCNSYSE